MVAAGTGIIGEFVLSDSLHIDGKVEGSVKSDSEVSIGQSGQFEGQMQAERVMVSGKLTGNVQAQCLEVVSGGVVDGDVEVGELVIESGGQFNGTSKIRGQEAPRQLGYSQSGDKPAAEEKKSEKAAAGDAAPTHIRQNSPTG